MECQSGLHAAQRAVPCPPARGDRRVHADPADQEIFNQVRNEIKPWTYKETLKHYERLQKDIIARGGKIHHLTAEEKSLYLKDAFALYPEVKKVSGPIGNKFIELLAPYRDK